VAGLYLDGSKAFTAALLFVFFPPNLVYGTVAYTEPLFLALVLLGWLALEGDSMAKAGLWILLSALVRYAGALMFPVFSLIVLYRHRKNKREVFAGLTQLNMFLLPLLAWMFVVSPAMSPQDLDTVESHRPFFQYPLASLKFFLYNPDHPHWNQLILLHLVFLGSIVALWRFNLELFTYASIQFLFFSSFTAHFGESTPRYFATLWPAYILWAKHAPKKVINPALVFFYLWNLLGLLLHASWIFYS